MTYLGSFEDSGIYPEKVEYLTRLAESKSLPLTTRLRTKLATRLGYKPAKNMLNVNKFLHKQLRKMQIITNPISVRFQGGQGGEAIAYHPNQYEFMYFSVLSNSTARPMLNTRKREIFRNGYIIERAFTKKCEGCQTDYDYDVDECENESCPSPFDIREPDPTQREIVEDLTTKRLNRNRQSLTQIFKLILEDMDIADDGWLAVHKDYLEQNGEIIDSKIREIWRINPAHIAFSVTRNNIIGQHEYTCIDHRSMASYNPFQTCVVGVNKQPCGKILHSVYAVRYRPGTQTIIFRYLHGEIIHTSLYRPSDLYGYPGALTLYYELKLTNKQVKYMADYYDEKKVANAYLGIPTRNIEEVKDHMDQMKLKLERDSHSIPYFGYDPDSKTLPTLIRMDASPKEMEFIQVREEARNRMAAYWGVSPIFNADLSAGGGLNNEGLQFTVTNRGSEDTHNCFNEEICAPLVRMAGVTDWKLLVHPSEEQDEVAELDRQLKKDQSALYKSQLGFEVEMTPEGDYKFMKAEGQNGGFGEEQEEGGGFEQIAGANLPEGGEQSQFTDPEGAGRGRRQAGPPMVNNVVPKGRKNQALPTGSASGSPRKPAPEKTLMKMFNKLMKKGTPADQALKVVIEMSNHKEPYSFVDEYPDWQWKDDYEILEYRTEHLAAVIPHPDFEISQEDIIKESPRVRPKTLRHYLSDTDEMEPLVVDENFNLLDGYHRLYVLKLQDQVDVRLVVVRPKTEQNIILEKMINYFQTKADFKEEEHPRDKGGEFTSGPGSKSDKSDKFKKSEKSKKEKKDATPDMKRKAIYRIRDDLKPLPMRNWRYNYGEIVDEFNKHMGDKDPNMRAVAFSAAIHNEAAGYEGIIARAHFKDKQHWPEAFHTMVWADNQPPFNTSSELGVIKQLYHEVKNTPYLADEEKEATLRYIKKEWENTKDEVEFHRGEQEDEEWAENKRHMELENPRSIQHSLEKMKYHLRKVKDPEFERKHKRGEGGKFGEGGGGAAAPTDEEEKSVGNDTQKEIMSGYDVKESYADGDNINFVHAYDDETDELLSVDPNGEVTSLDSWASEEEEQLGNESQQEAMSGYAIKESYMDGDNVNIVHAYGDGTDELLSVDPSGDIVSLDSWPTDDSSSIKDLPKKDWRDNYQVIITAFNEHIVSEDPNVRAAAISAAIHDTDDDTRGRMGWPEVFHTLVFADGEPPFNTESEAGVLKQLYHEVKNSDLPDEEKELSMGWIKKEHEQQMRSPGDDESAENDAVHADLEDPASIMDEEMDGEMEGGMPSEPSSMGLDNEAVVAEVERMVGDVELIADGSLAIHNDFDTDEATRRAARALQNAGIDPKNFHVKPFPGGIQISPIDASEPEEGTEQMKMIVTKGWTSETFKQAETRGVVKRGEGGRFAANPSGETQPLKGQETKPKKGARPSKERKVYETYLGAREKAEKIKKEFDDLERLANKVDFYKKRRDKGLIDDTKTTYESERIAEYEAKKKKHAKLKKEIDKASKEIEKFVDTSKHPQAVKFRKLATKRAGHVTKLKTITKEARALDKKWDKFWDEAPDLTNLSRQERMSRTDTSEKLIKQRQKLHKSLDYQEDQIKKTFKDQDNALRYLAHPGLSDAEEISKIQNKRKFKSLRSKVVASKNYFAEKKALVAWRKKQLKKSEQRLKGAKSKADKLAGESHLKSQIKWLASVQKDHDKAEADLKTAVEGYKSSPDYKNLKKAEAKTTMRLNKEWGHYDTANYKGATKKWDRKVQAYTKSEARQMFREEFNYAIQALNIDLVKNPELLDIKLKFQFKKSGQLGYSSVHDQTINLNPKYFIKGEKTNDVQDSLQQTIRHEIAHHFVGWNVDREYFKHKKEVKDLEENFARISKERPNFKITDPDLAEMNKRYMFVKGRISRANQQLNANYGKEKGSDKWRKGHHAGWRDTCEVLFGTPPLSRYDGGNPYKEESEI